MSYKIVHAYYYFFNYHSSKMKIKKMGRQSFLKTLRFRIFTFLVIVAANFPVNSNELKPKWWNNDIGKEEIVLPGFFPLKYLDQTILLGAGRKYIWKNTFLPVEMFSKGKLLVTNTKLSLVIEGKEIDLNPSSLNFSKKTEHHAVIYGETVVNNRLKISVVTRVEYDGVAMVEVTLKPLRPIVIEGLYVGTDVVTNPWSRMMVYEPDIIGDSRKKIITEPHYNGAYLNAIAIVDGEKSYWWFQDNAEGWLGQQNHSTIIKKINNNITIKQNLINGRALLFKEQKFRFNFLVTPVKDGIYNIRENRVAKRSTPEEKKNHGLNLWWISAFAHQNLPYVNYPPGIKNFLHENDKKVYPGLADNLRILQKFKKNQIDRLPYFSAHTLNRFDPSYQAYRKLWEVKPEKIWKYKYDNPFVLKRNDAFLTHRARGYTDYLLYRFSVLIDQLGFEGIYFDQGSIVQSANPLNGLWIDSNGQRKGSTDILALRDFHKRLATLFYLKGKKGLIFSHNSNTMIFPAYTFVSGMVQGEEFIHKLKDYDYIDSTTLDEVRSKLNGRSYGVATIWLEVIFAGNKRLDKSKRPYEMSTKKWINSTYYEKAYLNFMAFALLHDMPTWSFVNIELRSKVLNLIDWIQPKTSEFIGYWRFPKSLFKNKLFHSYYLSKDKKRLLMILVNLNKSEKIINVNKLIISHEIGKIINSKCKWLPRRKANKTIRIKSKQFKVIQLVCSQ